MWVQKYKPDKLSNVSGNQDSIAELDKWAKDWNIDSQPVILHGPPGTGKTTSAHTLSDKYDWDVIEMNASDKRTGSIVDKIAGEASRTKSLTNKNKVIIIDEADNLHGNYDRGGKKSILNVIDQSRNPIILIGNDYYEFSRSLRNKTKEIEYDYISNKEIAKRLRDICNQREIDYEIDALKKIARVSDGDMRVAVNDLQKYASGKNKLCANDINDDVGRNQKVNIFPYMDSLFMEDSPKEAKNKSQDIDMTPNELIRWIKQNISNEYTGEKYIDGIESISKSEIWLGRVTKTQNYKFWKYADDSMTAGVAESRDQSTSGWTRWSPPRYKSSKDPSSEFLQSLSDKQNVSIQTSRKDIIPYLSEMIAYCKPKNLTINVVKEYGLDNKDLSIITGSGKDTNKVNEIIDESRKNEDKNDQDEDNNVKSMISELTNINGIGQKTAKNICKNYDSIDSISETTKEELSKVDNLSISKSERILKEYGNYEQDKNLSKNSEESNGDDKDVEDQSDIEDFI